MGPASMKGNRFLGPGRRIRRLLERLNDRLRERPWFVSRPILLAESLRQTEGQSVHRRRALAFAHLLSRAPTEITAGELIVGSHPGDRPDGVDQDALNEARAYMASQSARGQFHEHRLTRQERAALDAGMVHHIAWRDGHVIVDYAKMLRLGFDGVRQEVQAANADADKEGREFLGSVLIALDAGVEFVRRYAALAHAQGMTHVAAQCESVAASPPRTLAEALQLYWFTHLLVALEEGSWGYSFGRFDQRLMGFCRRDLTQGTLTPDSALELIECFWLKINEYQVTGDSATMSSQNLTLGGVGQDGLDATNDLTYLALDATEALRLRLPNVSVRIHAHTPDALWERLARLMQAGCGQPQVYNDDVMVPSLVANVPMPVEAARSYAIQGCIETHIPGQCAPWMDCAINLAGCLLLALNRGCDLATGKQLGAPTPRIDDGLTFDDLIAAYEGQAAHFVRMLSSVRHRFDAFQPSCDAVPFCSALIADCVERGRDAYDRGARHKWAGVYCVGAATTADSLLVLKRLLAGRAPEGPSVSTFIGALRTDFRADPVLREWAASVPKYGNDIDEVDALAKRVSEFVCDTILNEHEADEARLLPMLSSHTINVRFGQLTPATPDGRVAGEPLSNGMSPSLGCDRLGPTAVIRSATKIDYTKSTGSSLLNLKFAPATFAGPEGASKLASLLRGYFSLAGHQVQVNFVDQKVLLDAQANPRRHENLVVRVSGFCSKFVCLPSEIQNEIIRRTSQQ